MLARQLNGSAAGSEGVLTVGLAAVLDGLDHGPAPPRLGDTGRPALGSGTAGVVRRAGRAGLPIRRSDACAHRRRRSDAGCWPLITGTPPAVTRRGGSERQFELNRFNRAWRAANPGSPHTEMLAAWPSPGVAGLEESPAPGCVKATRCHPVDRDPRARQAGADPVSVGADESITTVAIVCRSSGDALPPTTVCAASQWRTQLPVRPGPNPSSDPGPFAEPSTNEVSDGRT